MTQLRRSMIGGPYALVASEAVRHDACSHVQGRPIRDHLEGILGGPVIESRFAQTSMLVSIRGGDLELSLGQDISIGYSTHDGREVELYLTESFTFQVLDPAVMVFFSEQRDR
jgi:uncharacterized linocin/CFP29 family protein